MVNLIVVGAYVLGVIALGTYLGRYVRRDEDFFLAGRSLNKWVIAGTVMATNVAAIYLVGPAGLAYRGAGFSALLIAWTGNMIAAASALLFVPRLRRLRLTTITELLEFRYSPAARLLPTIWWILYYALFAGNATYTLANSLLPVLKPFEADLGFAITIDRIIWVVSGAVILYCFVSGLVAVVYSDVIQAFLIIIGGMILLPLALKDIGGVTALAGHVDSQYFVFWKPGWVKAVTMWTLLGLPYWCTSQYMLQRSLAGRTVRDASRGLILAALLTGPITLAYIVPGICASQMDLGAAVAERPDLVLPTLFERILPIGLGGLFIAALVSASNSTASSLLNSMATLGEHDVYRRFVPNRSSGHYTWAGRLVTIAGGALGLVFAFNVERLGGIILANYKLMALFEPPIFVIIAAALFWRRANAKGVALVALAWVVFNAVTLDYGFLDMFGLSDAFRSARRALHLERLVMDEASRTIYGFPVFAAAMVVGTYLGNVLAGRPQDVRRRTEVLFGRMKSPPGKAAPSRAWAGIALSAVALVAFVLCSVFEVHLPKPANALIFMGLMMTFVFGCYLAVPVFVPPEPEPTEVADIAKSLLNRFLGCGWTWLGLYVAGAVLVVVLYFI